MHQVTSTVEESQDQREGKEADTLHVAQEEQDERELKLHTAERWAPTTSMVLPGERLRVVVQYMYL